MTSARPARRVADRRRLTHRTARRRRLRWQRRDPGRRRFAPRRPWTSPSRAHRVLAGQGHLRQRPKTHRGQWNKDHPNGQVTLHELPDNADQQRQQMIQNTQIKNPKMAVLSVDVVWTAEFAANGYVVAAAGRPVPDRRLPASRPSTRATYFNKLYAYPTTSDGGLLYYRKDLLDKYDLQPPTTFDEMKAACKKIKDGRGRRQARLLRRPVPEVRGPDGELRRGRQQRRRRHRRRRRQAERQHPGGQGQGSDTLSRLVQGRHDPQGCDHLAGGAGPSGVPGRQADLPPQLALRVQPGAARPTARPRSPASSTSPPLPGISRPGRLQPRRAQLRHRRQRREQGHRGRLHQVHRLGRGPEVERARHVGRPDRSSALHRPRPGQEVPLHADPAEVDPDRAAAAEGRRVRRRHPGHPGRRLRRPAGADSTSDAALCRPADQAES